MKPSRAVPTVVAVTCLLIVAACSGGESDDDVGASQVPDGAATASADSETTDEVVVEIPETPVGTQTRWAIDQLGATDGPSTDEAQATFADVFLDEAPADDMAALFAQLRAYGPFEVTGYQGTETTGQTALRNAAEEPMTLEVAVDDAGLITGLFLRQTEPPPEIGTWAEVDAAYADVPGARLFAAEVADGTCEPIHTYGDAHEPAPLGSTFKLYVLGAVQQAVLDGDLSWDETVTLTAESRVPTSVDTNEIEDGSQISLADAARSMIAVSDNTATDLLIDAVGRAAVEQAVADMGHADPATMRPLLTTREIYLLGWTDSTLRERWSDADEQERRAILESLPDGSPEIDPADVVDPVHPYGVDWFASGRDICAAHVAVQQMAADDDSDVVRDLMAANPGITLDTETWPYVAYKGGSAPGVLAGSWYLEEPASKRGAGKVLVVQFAGDDPAALSDLAYMFGVVGNAVPLLTD